VATYGGGTGLPTQRDCLELLGCYGAGQVRKFAEIVAATVLCGEISLVRRWSRRNGSTRTKGSAGTALASPRCGRENRASLPTRPDG